MIFCEILRDHGRAVAPVKNADVCGRGLGHEKRADIVPLGSNGLVQGIVDQHGEKKSFSLAPIGDLHTFSALIQLDVFFLDCRRLGVFLSHGRNRGGDRFGSACDVAEKPAIASAAARKYEIPLQILICPFLLMSPLLSP